VPGVSRGLSLQRAGLHRRRVRGELERVLRIAIVGVLAAGGALLARPPASPELVFAQRTSGGAWALVASNARGEGAKPLTSGKADDWEPCWSPGGERLAFTSRRDGNWELYACAPDGSGAKRLTDDPGADMRPVVSPDGKSILFESDRTAGGDLYLAPLEAASAARRLTSRDGLDGQAAFSPDGASVAYVAVRGEAQELRLLTLAGGSDVVLDTAPLLASLGFLPDGSAIVYVAKTPEGSFHVTQVDLKARMHLRFALTRGEHDTDPAVAPDGKRIAFVRAEGGVARLMAIDLATGTEKPLERAAEPDERFGRLAWSPDATRLAFTVGPERDVPVGPNALVVLDVESGVRTVIARGAECADPAWRPR